MAPTSATRIIGLIAFLLALAGAQATTTSTTGGAPDAGTTSSSLNDCGGTPTPAAPLAPGETPAPTISVRCLPSSILGSDDSFTYTPSPTEAEATPEPTVVGDSTGMVPPEPTAPTPPPTETIVVMPTGSDGSRDLPTTAPEPTGAGAVTPTEEALTPSPVVGGASAVPTTPAPMAEGGQTAEEGDAADGAFGPAAPSVSRMAVAASCGLLLAAGVFAL
eukprot:g17865.t1